MRTRTRTRPRSRSRCRSWVWPLQGARRWAPAVAAFWTLASLLVITAGAQDKASAAAAAAAADCSFRVGNHTYNLSGLQNTALQVPPPDGSQGSHFNLSVCEDLPFKCIDSLTHVPLQGNIYQYFGQAQSWSCWDVLSRWNRGVRTALPIANASSGFRGLRLVHERRGDAHLSCKNITTVTDLICDHTQSRTFTRALASGFQSGCRWFFSVRTAAVEVCSPDSSDADADDASTVVCTPENGCLQGLLSRTGRSRSFLGVRYARPPVGPLRWRAPQRLRQRFDVDENRGNGQLPTVPATSYAPSCMQQGTSSLRQDEDCLFLNIFAPVTRAKHHRKHAVLFWIHGGCYVEGTPNSDLFNGSRIVEQFQDVIVVTVTYRLSVFGFLGAKALSDDTADGSFGNWGIQDQRAGLQWVRRHIHRFGGDASRVTIFGQSAGAGSVAVHLAAHRSWGLFSGAIMESGSFANWISMDANKKNLNGIRRMSHCNSPSSLATASCLRSIPASELAKMAGNLSVPCRDGCTFAPVVDGVELVDYPWRMIRRSPRGLPPRVNVLHGTNMDDGLLFVNMSRQGDADDFAFWLRKMYGPRVIPQLRKYFPLSRYPATGPLSQSFWAAERVETDFAYFCPAHQTSQTISRAQSGNVYQYRFTQRASGDRTVLHGDELPFVWLMWSHSAVASNRQFAIAMATAWTNFARTGDPNRGKALPKLLLQGSSWPAWPSVLDLSRNTSVHHHIDVGACHLFDKRWHHFGTCLPCRIADAGCN